MIWINMPMPTNSDILACLHDAAESSDENIKQALKESLERPEVQLIAHDCGPHFRSAEFLFNALCHYRNPRENIVNIRVYLANEMI